MSVYLSAVIADNPFHYWRCADPSGVILNDIGSSAELLLKNGGQHSTGYSGPVSDGGSAVFTDNNGFSIQSADVTVTTWSSELWFYYPSLQTVNAWLFDAQDNSGNTMGSIAFVPGTGMVLNAGGANLSSPTPSQDRWHHVVGDSNAAASHLYFDGVLKATGPGITQTRTIGFGVGARVGNSNPFAGAIAEVAYYHTVIGAARVAAHFAAADLTGQPPVSGASGGLGGAGSSVGNPVYVDILQQILQSVRKLY